MVNLLQCPTEDDRLIFEFRHNDFGDSRDKLYFGTVSFPIQKLTEGYEKPIKMIVKYNDSANTTRSIELTYKLSENLQRSVIELWGFSFIYQSLKIRLTILASSKNSSE